MSDETEDDIDDTTDEALEATEDADDATEDSDDAADELPALDADEAADDAELATELADDAVTEADDAALVAEAEAEEILLWAAANPAKTAQSKCLYMATIVSTQIWRYLS